MNRVTFIIHIFALLGINTIILTNAAGSVNNQLKPGDIMVIKDYINLMGTHPLIGITNKTKSVYLRGKSSFSPQGIEIVENVSKEVNQTIKKGVLLATTGPSYETAAEIRMARLMGADAVSMSTIPEVITARYYDLNVIGLSCITNMATGINFKPLSHDEVTDTAKLVQDKFFTVTTGIIDHLFKSR
jgi:purine-nucleoside phosphorylase